MAEEAEEPRWFVIHTYSGYENKVKQNLEHRIDSMEMKDQIFRNKLKLNTASVARSRRKFSQGMCLCRWRLPMTPGTLCGIRPA
jgi:transcription antitermination factor NusG